MFVFPVASPFRLRVVTASRPYPRFQSRHVERSVWISLTTLTCLLRIEGYGTYPAGAIFG
jgi:hypothetical protein